MADPRTPYYELHIRPLIRLLDRTQMRFKFDLWSYDDVKANADDIVRVISDGTMPPPSHGGPWPREWIDLFARWQATGFQKLEVATASAGITAARVGPLIRVTAKGKHPAPGYTAWLDIESVTDDRREYRLVAEPPFPAQAGPEPGFTARDQFRGPATAISLIVVDSQGPHEIQVPATNIVHVLGTPGAVKDRLADAGLAMPHDMPKGIATELHVAEHVVKVVAEDLFTEVSGTDEAIAMLSELL